MLKRHVGRIVDIVDEAEDIKSFYIKVPTLKRVIPGQFVMVWVVGFEEIPISPSLHEGDILRLTVAKVGETTSAMHRLKVGDKLIIRGPYGRGFSINCKSAILVGGGYGVAPLIFLARVLKARGCKIAFLVGAKTANKLLFLEEAKRLNLDIVACSTEDGSKGFKGLVVDLIETLNVKEYDNLMACGPEKMLVAIVKRYSKLLNVEVSLERYMKCGVGICGSCAINGLLVCKDGPVFKSEELEGTDFGKFIRNASGSREPI